MKQGILYLPTKARKVLNTLLFFSHTRIFKNPLNSKN